jgi:hypothetical protein
MGSLWKELAARWLGIRAAAPELPSMTPAETGKQKPRGDTFRSEHSSIPALTGVSDALEDQSPEEALPPDAAVRYPCRPRSRQARGLRETLPTRDVQEIDP